MIKAVFFDFFNTLVYFDPPREKHYADTAAEFGVRITPEAIAAALPEADAWWRAENFRSTIKDREQSSKFDAYRGYGLRILRDADNTVSPDQALQILAGAFSVGFKFKNYDDSLPALGALKGKKMQMGVISNIGEQIDSYLDKAGFTGYFAHKITSFEAGCDKPQPQIFQLALKRAGIAAAEALFVGDQYDLDVIGARSAGIKPILINRDGAGGDYDCAVINHLSQVIDYL
ncbi:MAG: HAD-IA family hydrolase [Chloroflexi bacterium]|nr:HAD-IA family hydrolase [Chloroflexota bacterium]